VCADVREALRGGSSLAEAVAKAPGLAAPRHLAVLRSGAESGRLDHAAALIDRSIGTSERLRRTITGRMIYPAMLLVAALGAVWFLATFVIPKFAETLTALGGEIPWQTQLTLSASRVGVWLLPPLIACAIAMIMLRGSWMTPALRRRIAEVALRTPVVGTLIWNGQAAMVTDVMATMLEGGSDVLSALDQARDVATSPVIAGRLVRARQDVREGADVGEALHNQQVLPPLVAAIVRAGTRGGDLVGSLRRASGVCADRQDALSSRLLTLLEPAVIALLAAVVGWVVYSLVTGMLAMNEAASL
jgi:type II secretory pathway component PulF